MDKREETSGTRFYYELGNHLGNILVTVSDRKLSVQGTPATVVAFYLPDVVSTSDYTAFGAPMPGRDFTSSSYRYGFNGKEKDDEIKGSSGTSYDYGFRIYDPRLGRFLSVDPLFKTYPWFTPYQFSSNDPIRNIDIDGLEGGSAIEYVFTSIGNDVKTWWNSWSLVPTSNPTKPAPPIKSDPSKTEVKKTDAADVKKNENTAKMIKDSKKVEFGEKHPSPSAGYSKDDDANAIDNITDASNNKPAKTSPYSDVGSTEINLNSAMLAGMKTLSEKYTFSVSEISGGDHSTGSQHYSGTAFDVTEIDNKPVNINSPNFKAFMKDAKAAGATLTLGPGDKGHGTHVHVEWKQITKKK